MKRSTLISLLTLTLLVLTPSALATNGYFQHGQGTTNKALGGAGVAEPQDALSGASNPAGISEIDREFFFSLALFNPNRSYTVNGQPTGFQGTLGLAPGKYTSDSNIFFMPSLAGVVPINEKNTLGISLVAHGGMNTEYPYSTFYGTTPTGVDLAQAFINTTWAYKVNENHSLGVTASVAYQRFAARGRQAFGMFSSDPNALTNNSHDSSFGLGFKLGYLGKLHDKVSFGLSYSPTIDMSEFDDYAGLFCGEGDFDIPANLELGFSFRPTNELKILVDMQRIYYGDVNSISHAFLPNVMEHPLGTEGGAGFGWKDISIYKIGFQWQPAGTWTWRLGYSNGENPVPESEVLFNILAPGVIEDHVTFGFSKDLGPNALHISVMYALESTVTGSNPLEAPGAQTIELSMDQWEVEFGYSYRF